MSQQEQARVVKSGNQGGQHHYILCLITSPPKYFQDVTILTVDRCTVTLVPSSRGIMSKWKSQLFVDSQFFYLHQQEWSLNGWHIYQKEQVFFSYDSGLKFRSFAIVKYLRRKPIPYLSAIVSTVISGYS